jgi:arsenite methyltransferase
MGVVNLYESPVLRDVTGPVIRPGGFELTERGLAHCRLAQGARVLDIGCGTGAGVDYMRRRHGLAAGGIDLSEDLLKEGLQAYRESFLVRGRAEQLPASDNCFRAVLGECVLSLCPSPQLVLREIWRVLEPGGHLLLTDVYTRIPGVVEPSGSMPVRCCLQGAVDRTTMENRVAAAGFDLLFWEDHTRLLKQLAAQLVWTYGSLDEFWSVLVGPEAARTMSREGTGGCSRPGYYLLVAQKPKTK